MKKSFLTILVVLLGIFSAQAQPYFSIDDLPDLVKCLPAPPDTTSITFAHDVMRYMWGKEMRADKARADIAERDAIWDLDTLAAIFSEPFGIKIDKEQTPEIYKAFMRGVGTIEIIRIRPKAYFMRKRPFDRFQEHMYTTWEEDELRGEGSYPSGHTIRGWAAALVLAEINPDAANEIYARGYDYGESRVIVGAHWQSDVDASRPAASIGYSLLQTNPAYRAQMDRARKEFAKLALGQQDNAAMAKKVWNFSKKRRHGFTLDINNWKEPKEGIAVSYAATQDLHGLSDLEYVVSHSLTHGGFIGGWYNPDDGQYYFDSVRLFPEDQLEEAKAFGRANNQYSVYILSSGTEIALD